MPNVTYELANKRIFVAGHRGLVGSAVARRLAGENCRILTADRGQLDLTDQATTVAWFETNRPDAVIVAAAKVGGIHANAAYPADFIAVNSQIAVNTIEAARLCGVTKLLYLGSACVYPRDSQQPISETALLSGPLEPTNEWYAIAKILGTKMCEAYRRQYGLDFISVQPANLYGPGDNFDPLNGHVVPGLIRKLHDAKLISAQEVTLWGTGTPRREFMYVDDLADAIVFALRHYSSDETLNIGSGTDLSIGELATAIAAVVGYNGKITFDHVHPDGMPRRSVDAAKLLKLGWRAKVSFDAGLEMTYQWFLANVAAKNGK